MKRTMYSVIALFFAGHLFAESTLREVAHRQMAVFEQSKSHRAPVVYPELAQRIEGMFLRYSATHIAITGVSQGTRKGTTDIYIKGDEIYVIDAAEGWNLVANNAGVFEWAKGHKDGIKIQRKNDDLVAYLYYLTDPSWIMASIYYIYLGSPNRFAVVPHKGRKWTELQLKKPPYGFEAIYVSEKPLWFYGMRMKNPKGGGRQEEIISEPKEMKGLPERFLQEFKEVKFENSNLALRRHMFFL